MWFRFILYRKSGKESNYLRRNDYSYTDYFQFVMGIVLFFFEIIFSLTSVLITILCGGLIAEVNSIVYRLFFALEMGIFITAGTLPLVVLVVFFSKNYVFSVLLCVFYSVLSLTAESSFGALPKVMCWLMPIPLTTLWSAGNLTAHGTMDGVGDAGKSNPNYISDNHYFSRYRFAFRDRDRSNV